MSITLILSLISGGILLSAFGIIAYKLKKGKKATNQNKILKRQKKSTVKLQRERDRNEKKKNKINNKLNTADPNKLGDAYGDGLQNLPD